MNAESGKPAKPEVRRRPIDSSLDGQGGMVGIGNVISPGLHLSNEMDENLPMTLAGVNHKVVWPTPYLLHV